MKLKNYYCIFITSFFFSFDLSAQDFGVDSKGKPVLSYYSFDEYRLNFDSDDPISVSTSFVRVFTKYRNKNTVAFSTKSETNLVKASGFTGKLSLLNSGDAVLSQDNIKDFTPGVELKIGYHQTIDEVLKKNIWVNTKGINLIGSMDNFRNYDPSVGGKGLIQPLSGGIEGICNWLYFGEKYTIIIGLNGTYLNGWNKDYLTNYQNLSEATVDNTVVALEDFAGRYGHLQTNINSGRIAGSASFYRNHFFGLIFVSQSATERHHPTTGIGLMLGMMNTEFVIEDSTFPSALAIGTDLNYTDNFAVPSLYFKASIGFYKSK